MESGSHFSMFISSIKKRKYPSWTHCWGSSQDPQRKQSRLQRVCPEISRPWLDLLDWTLCSSRPGGSVFNSLRLLEV